MKVKVELPGFHFREFSDNEETKIISVEQQQERTVLVLYVEGMQEPQVIQWNDVVSVTVDW